MTDKFEIASEVYDNAEWINTEDRKSATYASHIEGKVMTVVFQETAGKVDVMADLFFFPRKYKRINALVHGGFYSQFEKVKHDLLVTILNAIDNIGVTEIIIYGHSLGGAHALYLKQLLEHSVVKALVYCITTGAPRAFYWSPEFENIKENFTNTVCYVNGADAVPYLPVGFTNVVKHTRVKPFNLFRFFTGKDHLKSQYYNSIIGDIES